MLVLMMIERLIATSSKIFKLSKSYQPTCLLFVISNDWMN